MRAYRGRASASCLACRAAAPTTSAALAPRQPAPFGSFDQDTDSGSVSTVKRDSIYLFIMGLVPILIASRRLRAICKGK